MSGPPPDATPEERFGWWLERAEAGDGEAMLEAAECLEHGRGAPQDLDAAVRWYARATRAGVALGPALTGETLFERDPVAGLVWLMLGLERAAEGSELVPVLVSSLSVHGARVSDEAIAAAQVWADACRERAGWPDEVPLPVRVPRPFKPRPAPPADLPVREATSPPGARPVRLGGWVLLAPERLAWDSLVDGLHLRASDDGVTLHFASAQLAPGVDLDGYVRRSIASSAALWQLRDAPSRFLLANAETFSFVLDGAGPSLGQRALKRFAAVDDRVSVLTAIAAAEVFEQRLDELGRLFDSLRTAPRAL